MTCTESAVHQLLEQEIQGHVYSFSRTPAGAQAVPYKSADIYIPIHTPEEINPRCPKFQAHSLTSWKSFLSVKYSSPKLTANIQTSVYPYIINSPTKIHAEIETKICWDSDAGYEVL